MTAAILAILLPVVLIACEPEPRLVDPDLRVAGELVSKWDVPEHRKSEAAGICSRYGGTALWDNGGDIECCLVCYWAPEPSCSCMVDADGAF